MNSLPNMLILGGCQTRWPLEAVDECRASIKHPKYGHMPLLHSFAEIFQLIACLRRERDIARELRMLALFPYATKAIESFDNFSGLDAILVEPSTPVDLFFRDVAINRNGITNVVIKPVIGSGKEAAKGTPEWQRAHAANKAAIRWLRNGLADMNETARAEGAAAFLKYVEDSLPNAELIRAVVRETRSEQAIVMTSLRRLREEICCPIGVVSYVFRYMPDGRAISWPVGFRDEMLTATAKLKLPCFDPVEMVQRYGIERAHEPGGPHYSEQFLPLMGAALVNFARTTYQRQSTAASLPS